MASLYLTTDNGSCFALNKCGFVSQSHPLQAELENILEFYPEMQRIIQFVHSFFEKIHVDENLARGSLFFKQVVIENEVIFKKLSLQEKAQILFDLYKATIIPILENDPIYSSAISELQARIGPEAKIVDFIHSIIDREINRLHSGFPLFSISHALEIGVEFIELPGEDTAIMNQKENLKISQYVLTLFQAILSAK